MSDPTSGGPIGRLRAVWNRYRGRQWVAWECSGGTCQMRSAHRTRSEARQACFESRFPHAKWRQHVDENVEKYRDDELSEDHIDVISLKP